MLSGTAFAVPSAHVADRVLVPARHRRRRGGGRGRSRARRRHLERAVTTNREIHPHLHLDGVTVAADELLAGGDPTRGTRW